MDLVMPACETVQTNDGRSRATVTGFVSGLDQVKKQFMIRVVQKVLESDVLTHINVVACMDCSARARHGNQDLPHIGNFVSFMGSVLFFEDDVAFVHVDDVGFVIQF